MLSSLFGGKKERPPEKPPVRAPTAPLPALPPSPSSHQLPAAPLSPSATSASASSPSSSSSLLHLRKHPAHSHAIRRDAVLKVLVVGASRTGKTSIIWQYIHGCHSQAYYPTIGVDVFSKQIPANTFHQTPPSPSPSPSQSQAQTATGNLRVDLWDVPFPEVKGNNVARIVQGAVGIVFVFNPSSPHSVDAVDEWRAALRRLRQQGKGSASATPRGIPMALLAHKSDIKKALISAEDLDEYASKSGYLFWRRTSVLEPAGVISAMDAVIKAVHAQFLEDEAAKALRKAEKERSEKIHIDPQILAAARANAAAYRGDTPPNTSPRIGSLPAQEPAGIRERAALTRRAVDLQVSVTDFYGKLQSDLARIKAQPAIAADLRQGIAALEEQRSEEYAQLIASATAVSSPKALQPTSDVSRLLDRAATSFNERTTKWRVLVTRLYSEAGLYISPENCGEISEPASPVPQSPSPRSPTTPTTPSSPALGSLPGIYIAPVDRSQMPLSPVASTSMQQCTPPLIGAMPMMSTSASSSSLLSPVASSAPMRAVSPYGVAPSHPMPIGTPGTSAPRRMGFSFRRKLSLNGSTEMPCTSPPPASCSPEAQLTSPALATLDNPVPADDRSPSPQMDNLI